MYVWQDFLRTEIELLLLQTPTTSKPLIINLYGPSLGKTYFSTQYKTHPFVLCRHVENIENDMTVLGTNTNTRIVIMISIDILDDSRIDYYFNVEETQLLPRYVP